jgi:hypothetical protein
MSIDDSTTVPFMGSIDAMISNRMSHNWQMNETLMARWTVPHGTPVTTNKTEFKCISCGCVAQENHEEWNYPCGSVLKTVSARIARTMLQERVEREWSPLLHSK